MTNLTLLAEASEASLYHAILNKLFCCATSIYYISVFDYIISIYNIYKRGWVECYDFLAQLPIEEA